MTKAHRRSAVTLRDALAKRAFNDRVIRDFKTALHHGGDFHRVFAECWADPTYANHRRHAYRLADEMLAVTQDWIDATRDKTLATALTICLLSKQ